MSRITREFLQKRAEHNEKVLTTIEEVIKYIFHPYLNKIYKMSLHQLNILKIENIDVHCRHIKILLL